MLAAGGWALTLALSGAETPPLPAQRPFYLGLTPFPPSFDEQGIDAAYAVLAKHADLVSHHFDDGIPWAEAHDGQPFPRVMEDALRLRETRSPKNAKVFLSCTPLAFSRDGLAGMWNTASNQPRTGTWKNKSWKDPETRKAYLNFCRRMIERFKPAYMAYGIEVNLYGGKPDFKDFKEFLAETYAALKKDYPRLPLCLTFVLADPAKPEKEAVRQALRELLPYSDLAAVSAHAFMEVPDPLRIAPAWLDQILTIKGTKPFAVAETSMPAETLDLPSLKVKLPSSPESQAAFLRWILRRCCDEKAAFCVWFLPIDYDRAWNTLQSMGMSELFKTWKDTGLFSEPGKPRPALETWDAWLALPRR